MKQDLTSKEYEIMLYIWDNGENGVLFGDLYAYVNTLDKPISRQRLNCHIQTLTAKGVLTSTGPERRRFYLPKISKAEYDQRVTNNMLHLMFGGSLKKFMVALNGGESLTEENAAELRRLLKNSRSRQ